MGNEPLAEAAKQRAMQIHQEEADPSKLSPLLSAIMFYEQRCNLFCYALFGLFRCETLFYNLEIRMDKFERLEPMLYPPEKMMIVRQMIDNYPKRDTSLLWNFLL